ESDLYKLLFEPTFETWSQDGNAGYKEMLCRVAFEMMEKRQSRFEDNVPAAVSSWLLSQGLTKRSGESIWFRHDTIRDFLASRYFVDGWEEVLSSTETHIGKHWLPTLRLAILEIRGENLRRELFSKLLTANPEIAGIAYREWKKAQTVSGE